MSSPLLGHRRADERIRKEQRILGLLRDGSTTLELYDLSTSGTGSPVNNNAILAIRNALEAKPHGQAREDK